MTGQHHSSPLTAKEEWHIHWPLVLASMIGLSLPATSIVTMGAFITPLEKAFGWSRSEVTSGLTIYSLVAVIGQPVVGRMVDLWGPRRIAVTGVLLSGITFSFFATIDGSLTGWLLRWLAYSVAVQCVQMPVWSSAVASEFTVGRGFALAIASLGSSWCSMIAPVTATLLIEHHGWSFAYFAIGVVQHGVSFVLAWFFFYSRRERLSISDAKRQHATPAGVPATEGLRTPTFYKMFFGTLISYVLGTAVSIHLIPILTSTGLSSEEAALVAGSNGAFALLGTIGFGMLTSRVQGHVLFAALAVMPVIAYLMLLMPTHSVGLRLLTVVFLGVSGGPRLIVLMYMTTRHFGLRAYATLFGFMFIPVKLSNGAGAALGSYLFDTTRSYDSLLIICTIGSFAAAFVMMSIGRYPADFEGAAAAQPTTAPQ